MYVLFEVALEILRETFEGKYSKLLVVMTRDSYLLYLLHLYCNLLRYVNISLVNFMGLRTNLHESHA